MIRSLVFDFGQVLVHFDPAYMVSRYVTDPEDAALLEEVLFDRLYWDRLDAGTITDEELLTLARERLPERLHAIGEKIYYNWIYNLPPVEGMHDLIRYVKATYGVPVYLLSNISTYFAAHAHEIPVLSELDGCVFSAVCGKVKPRAEIFSHLCERFGLIPEETVFVDDNAANIAGANAFGIHGYLFDGDASRLRTYLDSVLTQ